ncbi:hypothetical protein [Rhodopirellula europaea]|uniref:hypothetical protein n=1 Tax=Rhodopirellula europaea TaxID=1263866 RepID=UPI003D27C744
MADELGNREIGQERFDKQPYAYEDQNDEGRQKDGEEDQQQKPVPADDWFWLRRHLIRYQVRAVSHGRSTLGNRMNGCELIGDAEEMTPPSTTIRMFECCKEACQYTACAAC